MYYGIAVSAAVLGQSHKDNVRCTAAEQQLEAKLGPTFTVQHYLPPLDLAWTFWVTHRYVCVCVCVYAALVQVSSVVYALRMAPTDMSSTTMSFVSPTLPMKQLELFRLKQLECSVWNSLNVRRDYVSLSCVCACVSGEWKFHILLNQKRKSQESHKQTKEEIRRHKGSKSQLI